MFRTHRRFMPRRLIQSHALGLPALGLLLGACTVVDGDTSAMRQYAAPAAAQTTVADQSAPAIDTSSFRLPAARPSTASLVSEEAKLIPAAYTVGTKAELRGSGSLTQVEKRARVYARFESALNDAAASKLNTPREVRRILKDLRFDDAHEIAQGWMASRALIAARDPAFAKAVRDQAAQMNAETMLRKLQTEKALVQSIAGARSAAQAVLSATASDNQKMADVGQRFLTAARTFQNNKWGMLTPLPGMDLSRDYAELKAADDSGLSLADFAPIQPALAYGAPVMDEILSLGAQHLIEASGASGARDATLAAGHDDGARCLKWSRLNLNQCLAASHFPSEEAWCTAKHGIEEVRACWAKMLPAHHTAN